MYKNIVYMGKTLEEWQQVFFNEYTLGELYRMMQDGVNFRDMCKRA